MLTKLMKKDIYTYIYIYTHIYIHIYIQQKEKSLKIARIINRLKLDFYLYFIYSTHSR